MAFLPTLPPSLAQLTSGLSEVCDGIRGTLFADAKNESEIGADTGGAGGSTGNIVTGADGAGGGPGSGYTSIEPGLGSVVDGTHSYVSGSVDADRTRPPSPGGDDAYGNEGMDKALERLGKEYNGEEAPEAEPTTLDNANTRNDVKKTRGVGFPRVPTGTDPVPGNSNSPGGRYVPENGHGQRPGETMLPPPPCTVRDVAVAASAVLLAASVVILADDVTGVGVADDPALLVTVPAAVIAVGVAFLSGGSWHDITAKVREAT